MRILPEVASMGQGSERTGMKVAWRELGQGVAGARLRAREIEPERLERLRASLREPEPVIRCLINRGLETPEAVSDFLEPDFGRHRHDPLLLRDMGRAVERLQRAVRDGEKILIVTDFDVDGTTSSVILTQTLRLLGGADLVTAYIPDRFTEGYGLSTLIVERAAAEGFGLILTADIGIKSHEEARLAARLGIDLLICDHHLPDGEDVPAEAYAVLCPKGSAGLDYPNKHLAACGVALKLAEALLGSHPRREAIVASLAKMTAIGTISDLVDLAEMENRAIVAHGLRALGQPSTNPGLRALFDLAGAGDTVTAIDIGFRIGPRINAAGRIAHASTVLSLFDATTDEEARRHAQTLDELNTERRGIQQQLVERVETMVSTDEAGRVRDRVILIAGSEADGFHRGVVGIACSKIVEQTGRPTLICAVNDEGMAHGSARSIEGFHIVEALQSVSDLLVKFGGHPMAAGFTVPAAKIEEMRWRLNHYAEEALPMERLGRVLMADAILTVEEVSLDLLRRLARLEPHGIGNPSPNFYLSGVQVRAVRVLKERHLKLSLAPGLDAIWWNSVRHREAIESATRVSLMGRLDINRWNERETCQITVLDALPGDHPISR
ncbi:MAG: single-stranded-DNA-specific exonuclease RecJ [Blastocatellia bacterium]